MKVVALISGGKDSCFNMMQCIAAGHEIVALANILPYSKSEIDSYMYQSVGYEAITLIAESMDLPLFRTETHGQSHQQGKIYEPTESDEVEDLFNLLLDVKSKINYDAVSVGAILSDYQRVRVENVCIRLNVVPLAYLWQRNQEELLQDIIKCEIDAIIIKVAALGLDPSRHLGRSLRLVEPHLVAMHEKYGLNVCGEGGEYETLTIDCPLYKSRIVIEESETIIHSDDPIAPVGYLKLNKLKLELKLPTLDLENRLMGLPLKDSDGYITDDCEEAIESEEADIPDISNNVDTQPDDTLIDVKDIHQETTSVNSKNGWLWISGIRGDSNNPSEAIKEAMDKLKYELTLNNQSLQDICSISMFISDMSQFSELNRVYREVLNHANPPSRACVQVPLPGHCPVILEAVSWNSDEVTNAATGDLQIERHTMHVQSVSHWAPANIGPYSQVVKVGDIVHLAGQIGLVPGSMRLVSGGIRQECQLSLRHIGRLLKAIDANLTIRDVVQGICYLCDKTHVETARKYLEESTNNSIMDFVVVTSLPRNALVEWHVWAHSHNNQFEYEETGKCIEDWSISVYRRWNYENNIAAIVCHLDNTENVKTPITADILKETLDYVLHKLHHGHEYDSNSICCLKVFYSVKKAISSECLSKTINEIRNTMQLSYTIVPVVSLKCDSTYLSICGVRNQ